MAPWALEGQKGKVGANPAAARKRGLGPQDVTWPPQFIINYKHHLIASINPKDIRPLGGKMLSTVHL